MTGKPKCHYCNDTGIIACRSRDGQYAFPGPVPDDAKGYFDAEGEAMSTKSAVWVLVYIASVVAVNVAFDHWPQLAWLWSVAVGSIFVSRDFCQRRIGHWVIAPMVVALAISYWMASPFIALASGCAFAASETTDWLVFTVTKRPLKDRVLLSCALSAPVDSAIFLGMIGAFGAVAFSLQVISKLVAALIVWSAFWSRERTVRLRALQT